MRKFMLSMWLTLSLLAGSVCAAGDAVLPDYFARPAEPTGGPADSRRPVVDALKANDAAALIVALHGETELAEFLNEGGDETRASIAAKIAEEPGSTKEEDWLRLWTTLAGTNGVALVSAELYPQWQAQIPQMLATAQMGLTAMGAAIAEDASMTALERSQLIELQWALTGWLSRTDFSDRKSFDKVLAIARDWIVASGAAHPLELVLTAPQQRLKLADDGIRSVKRALRLYGLDADAVLASVRFDEISRDDKQARLRTSFTVLDVPLQFEEDLAWFDGRWMDARQAEAMQATPDPEPLDMVPEPTDDEMAEAVESAD